MPRSELSCALDRRCDRWMLRRNWKKKARPNALFAKRSSTAQVKPLKNANSIDTRVG
jgi:hypothetical protein